MPDINYWAVIVSALSSMVIGSLWFGPLFGKSFRKGLGMESWDPEKQTAVKKAMPQTYAKQLIMSLVMAVVFAHVLWAFRTASPDMTSVMAGLQGGFWMWLGFAVPIRYGESLWNGQEFKYTAIDLGYWLVLLVVYGIILSVWR